MNDKIKKLINEAVIKNYRAYQQSEKDRTFAE
jgi:hypothetical protein